MAARQFSVDDVLGILDGDDNIPDIDMDEFCFDGSDDEVSNFDRYE